MKYPLIYGSLSGAVIIAVMLTGIVLGGNDSIFSSIYFGYLTMLVAMTFIFVGVKRYRDVERGGVIGFGPAFAIGLATAGVAALIYIIVWEIYLASTDYAFMPDYIASLLEQRRAEGASAAVLAREAARYAEMEVNYRNPLYRVGMTFLEIFPAGLLVALFSAALLRNPRLLPATLR